jgi:hypothetical protein
MRKSQKNTSCGSLNMYLSRYLCGVNLVFMLSFCVKSSSFVFNHLLIYAFVGFHGLNIPLYTVIIHVLLPRISSTQSHVVPLATEPFVGLNLSFTSWSDPGLDMIRVPTKPSKTIGPPGKPEGNTTHRVHCAVSPEIALWVTAILK